MKKQSLILLFCFYNNYGFSQNNVTYIDSNMIYKFDQVTELEIWYNDNNHKLYKVNYQDFFNPLDSEFDLLPIPERKNVSIKKEKEIEPSYLENMVRKFGKNATKLDTLSGACLCELKNTQLFIYFDVDRLHSTISIDNKNVKHEILPYAEFRKALKVNLEDTIVTSELYFDLKTTSIKLYNKKNIKIGRHINGYVEFDVPQYYMNEDAYLRKDKCYICKNGSFVPIGGKTKVYFTCKIRDFKQE